MALPQIDASAEHRPDGPPKLDRRGFLGLLGGAVGSLAVPSGARGRKAASPSGLNYSPPFGVWRRIADDPILRPRPGSFESAGVFNPAVIMRGDEFVMLYRAQDAAGTSRLGMATSRDGIHFARRSEPVLAPEESYERGGGVEDPRLVKTGQTYFLTYTGYNRRDAQLCLAQSRDLVRWERCGIILPAYQGRWNVGWTKAGAVLSRQIGGKYWMYYQGEERERPGQVGVVCSSDLLHWTEPVGHPVLRTRPGEFDAKYVEPGPPPVLVREGILLIYNAADDRNVFATGWALFDRSRPTRLLARSAEPIFRVEEPWEKVGQVPNVVFVEGMVRHREWWLFYYGAADKYVAVARAADRT